MSRYTRKTWTYRPPQSIPLNLGHWATRDLSALWDFREGCEPTFDRSLVRGGSAAHTGTTYGSQGLMLNGSTDFVSFGNDAEYEISFGQTWVVRFKLDSVSVNNHLVGKRESAGNFDGWQMRVISNARPYVLFKTAGPTSYQVYPTDTLSADVWYTMVATFESNQVKMYVNGDLLGTTTGVTGAVFTTAANFTIGALNGADQFTDGVIDYVARYDRVLNASEIIDLTHNPRLFYQPRRTYIPFQPLEVTDSGFGSTLGEVAKTKWEVSTGVNSLGFIKVNGLGETLNGNNVSLDIRCKIDSPDLASESINIWLSQTIGGPEATGPASFDLPASTGVVNDVSLDLTATLQAALDDTSNLDGSGGYNPAKPLYLIFRTGQVYGGGILRTAYFYDDSGDDDATALNYELVVTTPNGDVVNPIYYQQFLGGVA